MAKAKTKKATKKAPAVKDKKPAKLPPVFKTLKPDGKMTEKKLATLKDKKGFVRFLLPPYDFLALISDRPETAASAYAGILRDAEKAVCPSDRHALMDNTFTVFSANAKKNTVTVLVQARVETVEPVAPADTVDHNLEPVGTETVRVEHGPGVMTEVPRAFDPNPANAADTGGLPRVAATVSTDDATYEKVPFDATMWFEVATDEELRQLARDGWQHERSSDVIAEFMADHDADVKTVMTYVESIQDSPAKKDVNGFSVEVDKELALEWIGNHRVHLADDIARIESGEEEPVADEKKSA